ncbi:MAG: smalltalk protein [Bacteroidaceae bacterium]|nr:smalltalk protein [Bacteroidaceae bacterium]MBO4841126.1 smalltalk protein [Bacteroidaceae bacterium]
MKKETWKFVIQTVLAILTAIATTFGVTSCMGH